MADMPNWQIALAVAGLVLIVLVLIGTALGFIDWTDDTGTRS